MSDPDTFDSIRDPIGPGMLVARSSVLVREPILPTLEAEMDEVIHFQMVSGATFALRWRKDPEGGFSGELEEHSLPNHPHLETLRLSHEHFHRLLVQAKEHVVKQAGAIRQQTPSDEDLREMFMTGTPETV